MAVKALLEWIPLMALILAPSIQGGHLNSPGTHIHSHRGYSSVYAPAQSYYSPAQFQASSYDYTPPITVSQSFVASQLALLPQPTYEIQTIHSQPQHLLHGIYSSPIEAPVRQATISHSAPLASPALSHISSAPQLSYASSNFVTPPVSSNSYTVRHSASLTSQKASYPASAFYVEHQAPVVTQSVHHSAPLSQTYSTPALNLPLPLTAPHSQPDHVVSYTVPHSDYNYLKQYKQGDYQFQTGSSPITTNAYQQNEHNHHASSSSNNRGYQHQVSFLSSSSIPTAIVHHSAGEHQVTGNNIRNSYQTSALPSPNTAHSYHQNEHSHHVSSSRRKRGYQNQASTLSASSVPTGIVHHSADQHQVTGNNIINSYQTDSLVASAPIPFTINQVNSNQHFINFQAGSSPSLQASSVVHREESGHDNSEGYKYETGFQPIATTFFQQSSDHHDVNTGHSNHGDYSHGLTDNSGHINLGNSYTPDFNQVNTAPAPAVIKHIYFHVPPPELIQTSIQSIPVSPPKKTYNIVFVKVPSQDSRHRYSLQSSQAPVEEKTVIYVLVKKPDPQQLVAQQQPPRVNSQHEVYYVKYKGNIDEVANENHEELSQQNSFQDGAQSHVNLGSNEQISMVSAPLVSHSVQVIQHGSETMIEQQQLVSADAGRNDLQPSPVSVPGLANGYQ